MNEIRMIPIEQLAHHPENPRLELGDLTELTASIKANGILQNLTVVYEPEHGMTPEEWTRISAEYDRTRAEDLKAMMDSKVVPGRYLVVIGNRRLEASKAAGLTELPCSVREMDHQEQIATMLQENMQRSDLTVYEQAKGIQMMMDLGFDKNQIAERTGFSKKTIERRLSVATLPEKEAKKAVELGYDLLDLVEISKIDDRKVQKELLDNEHWQSPDEFDPSRLRQRIASAKREVEREKEKKRLVPEVEKFAKAMTSQQADQRWGNSWEHLNKYDMKLEPDTVVKRPKEDGTYYYFIAYGTIEIWQKAKKEKRVKSEAEIALEKRQHDAKELNARMRENRIAFCAGWKPSRMQEANLKARLWPLIFDNVSTYETGAFLVQYHNWNNDWFRQYCGMPLEEGRDPKETIYAEMARRGIPLGRALLAWILCGGVLNDDREGYASQYNCTHTKDADMDRVYDFLKEIDYVMTEEEQQWKDGTHPLFTWREVKADE